MSAQGEHAAAHTELTSAVNYFRAQGLYYYEAQGCLALANCELSLVREPELLEHLRRVLDLALRYDYEYWLQRELTNNPELFATEEAAEMLPADLRAHLATARKEISPPAITTEIVSLTVKPLVDLTINMLGPIEIVRDPTRPLAADAWVTRRARDILCFIASRRHRRAGKDLIIDTFWGETDSTVVERNFHPTVSHVRKALNSNQSLKQNLLLYREGDYLLNPEFAYQIDIDEFDRLLTAGETARRARQFDKCVECYEAAVALYRGEFMQGSYDPWVDEQRSYYRLQYLQLLESLAAIAQKTENWFKATQLAQQILRDDPFREDIHCLLMRSLAAQGNKGAIKEHFESLMRLLTAELGVEPSSETRKVYQELVGPPSA
jgi:DNA-binding SARP family transcriptional activator